eukprot:5414652-Ditylum_brightwellii.AAC.1
MNNWLNTGHQKKLIEDNAVDACPICLDIEETWWHLFQCQHEDSIAIRALALTIKLELLKLETAPILHE